MLIAVVVAGVCRRALGVARANEPYRSTARIAGSRSLLLASCRLDRYMCKRAD